jgi:hypothetical protein
VVFAAPFQSNLILGWNEDARDRSIREAYEREE